jgi:curved DNA-binding protein CbpA
LAGAARDRLATDALRMHRDLVLEEAVVAALEAGGASTEEAETINAEARARVDRELVASVALPPSSKRDLNYYFLLGVTPRAPAEDIRRAYRRKAKEVHPDRHNGEFVVDQWQDLMTVVADATHVLTDPRARRAYDVFWRQRSQSLAMRYRRPGDKRGDLQTRYLWEIAEMAQVEEAFSQLTERLGESQRQGLSPGPVLRELALALEQYEGRMIEVRIQARGLPDHLGAFADRVRVEMQRKERLVNALRELTAEDSGAAPSRLQTVTDVLAEIRQAQNLFELGTARPFI